MPDQTTRDHIVKAADELFYRQGYEHTSFAHISAAVRISRGNFYHHFKTKEAVFEAVFDQVSRDLVAEIDRVARAEKDVLAAMVAGTQHYFAATAKGPTGQIILRDGPAVLGWERWREIDARHFGGKLPRALSAAMDAGLIARQPVEPLARLLLGAVTEAAVACAGRADIARAGAEYARAFKSLVEALRLRE